jgi:hypothetical protein
MATVIRVPKWSANQPAGNWLIPLVMANTDTIKPAWV